MLVFLNLETGEVKINGDAKGKDVVVFIEPPIVFDKHPYFRKSIEIGIAEVFDFESGESDVLIDDVPTEISKEILEAATKLLDSAEKLYEFLRKRGYLNA